MTSTRPMAALALLPGIFLLGCSTTEPGARARVRIWQEPLVIPTYEVAPPDPNPRFYAGRAYQGAQGRVYPYPMSDRLTDARRDRTYKAVYLENEYVRVCVLPEIGGRIFAARDKTNNYDFLYRQHVIKPALVGMLGAWISGGVEWNIPHHHRASTFMPVAYALRDGPGGAKTVWVGEIERRHRTKWLVGVTLHPGRSYLEITIKVFNRTPLVHSFLCWANAAVHANEHYQVIFPPTVQYATYHAKTQFAHWPIAREIYKGVDYTDGVDISWWKNHPSPMSFFAWDCAEDFLAGYDHGRAAGVVMVADHHLVPGKKFWEWGPGPQGRMWDKILTDTDGPYVELMIGAYSDNQPDYSWLQPYEVKIVKQCWYPIRELAGVKQANREAAVNLHLTAQNTVTLACNTTARHRAAKVLLWAGDELVYEAATDIAPNRPFHRDVPVAGGASQSELRLCLRDSTGRELISYKPAKLPSVPPPAPAEPLPPPQDMATVEELCLAGQRAEQFYSPAATPDPYYEEALRRDPGDYRANLALGLFHLRRGLFAEAVGRFRTALKRVTANYTTPRDGEAYYYLGLALRFLGEQDLAYDALYKASWSHAFHGAAYYQLAEIDCTRCDWASGLEHIDRSLATNAWNTTALDLRCAVLRRLERFGEAAQLADEVLSCDPLDFRAAHELHLAHQGVNSCGAAVQDIERVWMGMGEDVQTYLELAVAYGNCGLYDEAIDLLSWLAESNKQPGSRFPMVYYYLGHYWETKGNTGNARENHQLASRMPPEYCFPFRLESISVLKRACETNPRDARAWYYLGNLLYERQPCRAMEAWETSRRLDGTFATVHRNLGVAYAQIESNARKAYASLRRAVSCDDQDPRLFFELDVVAEAAGVSAEQRLELLRAHHATVMSHNDAFAREVVLLTQLGRYDEAIDYMHTHHFRKWEGVGNIHDTYVDAHLLRGRRHLQAGRYQDAIRDYRAALQYPENLEVARPHHGGRECQVYYFLGASHEACGETEKARELYEKAAGVEGAGRAELCYYWGMALRKLGREENARAMFDDLVKMGRKQLEDTAAMEFFAKFGEQVRRERRMANAHYFMALGYSGKGQRAKARAECQRALELDSNHVWAQVHLGELKQATDDGV